MRGLVWELAYAARRLAKVPTFTLLCVLTIAVGMAAVTCVYSVMSAILLKPYPYKEPERLVKVFLAYSDIPESRAALRDKGTPTWCILDWREHCSSFESIAALGNVSNLTMRAEGTFPERAFSVGVTGNFFSTIGVGAHLGRTLLPEDSESGAARVVVLSHEFWSRRFGADPGIVGKTIVFNNESFAVVGVLSKALLPRKRVGRDEYMEPQVWLPLNEPEFQRQDSPSLWRNDWEVFARLRADSTMRQAKEQLAAATERLRNANSIHDYTPSGASPGVVIHALPLQEYTAQSFQGLFYLVLAIAALVLLIASVNVANYLLARALQTNRETNIRAALGARLSSLARLVVAESVIICFIGGGLGLLAAYAFTPAAIGLLPSLFPRANEITVDLNVLCAVFVLIVFTALICAILPMARLRKLDLQSVLKEGGNASSPGRRPALLRDALVVLESGAALLVLFCAVNLSDHFLHAMRADVGFNATRVISMEVALEDGASSAQFCENVVGAIAALPDVESAASSCFLPMARGRGATYRVVGVQHEADLPTSLYNAVSVDYFKTLGIPLKEGRLLRPEDEKNRNPVVVVDEEFQQRWFPGSSPLGAQVEVRANFPEFKKPPIFTVVGVVGRVAYYPGDLVRASDRVQEKTTPSGFSYCGQLYLPESFESNSNKFIVVRTKTRDPYAVLPSIQKAIFDLYPERSIYSVRTLSELRQQMLSVERTLTALIGTLAATGVLLAATGCHSSIAYRVAQRRQEFGVRIALGATPFAIAATALRHAAFLVVLGGLLAASVIVGCILFGLEQCTAGVVEHQGDRTWILLSVSIAFLIAMGSMSAYFPAQSASRIDPMRALRQE